jgi:hypothetical protein
MTWLSSNRQTAWHAAYPGVRSQPTNHSISTYAPVANILAAIKVLQAAVVVALDLQDLRSTAG